VRLRRLAARDADPRQYLAGANAAFGSWGDEAMFAWAFRDDAELLFVDDDAGRTVGGSAIIYRTLHDGGRAAIMGGSWTLPESRGRGVFTCMAEATRDVAAERGAIFLAFVRNENPSSRRFTALGAAMQPTFYCRSTVASRYAAELEPLAPDPALFPSSFLYTAAQWRTQFLERPNARVECVGRRGEWAAVVEISADFDRVHAVSDPAALPVLATHAHAVGRRLFWFATRRPAMECEWTNGSLAQLPLAVTEWELQNGDRM